MSDRIEVSSLVSSRTGEPVVTICWGKEAGQLSPEEARAHAQMVMEAAEAAETDAYMVAWLREELKAPEEMMAHFLTGFRRFREARRGGDQS